MRVERYDGSALSPVGAVTVGTFDGVHRGHQVVIESVIAKSRTINGESAIVTFDPHPREVVTGEGVALLTTVEERADAMGAMGVDRLIVLPFTSEMADWSAEKFAREVLAGTLSARVVVVGHDHGFGRKRSGDVGLLERIGSEMGFRVHQIGAHLEGDLVVSSTKIRTAIEEGRVADAAVMLGRPYRMIQRVTQGDQRGRTIGFPTANLAPPSGKVLPMFGVYAADVRISGRQTVYRAAVNVGVRPTFGENAPLVEVHLIDFEGDLYGQRLSVDFVRRVRAERRFDGLDALKTQLHDDVARCRASE